MSLTTTEHLIERLEHADALDEPARALAAVWQRLLGSAALRQVLSGGWIGHPLHPALVQLPAGLLGSASALDVIGGAPAARRRLVGLGVLAALPAALAGWSDWLDTQRAEKRVGLVHAGSNLLGIGAYAVSYLRRRHGGGAVAGAVGATFLSLGGWLGGHLVYAQGVGVDTTAFQPGAEDWVDVAAEAEVDRRLRRVDVGGVPVLLTRLDRGDGTAAGIVALAARCTHRGGDLTEGSRDGDCVECPWHASRFRLSDGIVAGGPASRPQPVYEVRVSEGRVSVRRQEVRAMRTNPVRSA